jgi:hypothetical protein
MYTNRLFWPYCTPDTLTYADAQSAGCTVHQTLWPTQMHTLTSWVEFPVPWKLHPWQPNKNTGSRSLCPLSSTEFVEPPSPEQNSLVRHWHLALHIGGFLKSECPASAVNYPHFNAHYVPSRKCVIGLVRDIQFLGLVCASCTRRMVLSVPLFTLVQQHFCYCLTRGQFLQVLTPNSCIITNNKMLSATFFHLHTFTFTECVHNQLHLFDYFSQAYSRVRIWSFSDVSGVNSVLIFTPRRGCLPEKI